MTTTPLGGGSVTTSGLPGRRLSGSALGRRHVLGSRTTALRRSTTAVPRVTCATTLLSALCLPGTGALLGTRATSLALPALIAGRSVCTTGNAVVPATARGLGSVRVGLDAARHRDLELLGGKLNARRAALAVATPCGLLLALRASGIRRWRTGSRALLGAACRISTVTRTPAATLGLHEEVCVIKALGRRHAVGAVKLGQGHAHIGRLQALEDVARHCVRAAGAAQVLRLLDGGI